MVREKILVRKLLHFKINSKMLVLYFGTNKVKKKHHLIINKNTNS